MEDAIYRLPPVPILQLEPQSDIEVDADNLLKVVEDTSKTHDYVHTSDISDGSPTQVRKMLHDASTVPCVTDDGFAPSLVLEEHLGPKPKVERLEEYQIEVPIIASTPESEQKPKCGERVALKDEYKEFIDFPTRDVEDTEIKSENLDNAVLARHQEYENVMNDKTKDEKADIKDKELRVAVPELEMPHFTDQRLQHSPHELMEQAAGTMQSHLMTEDPKAEMKMNWIPIPLAVMQFDLKEHVDDDSSRLRFVEKPKKVVRSEQLLYKEENPRILTLEDEEEEMKENLDLAKDDSAPYQTATLPRRAKFATIVHPTIASGTQNIECETYPTEPLSFVPLKRGLEACMNGSLWPNTQTIPGPIPSARRLKFANTQFTSESLNSFSGAGSLDAYLNLKGGRFKKPAIPISGYNDGRQPLSLPGSTEASDPIFTSQTILDGPPRKREGLRLAGSLRHPEESIEVPSTPGADDPTEPRMAVPMIDPLPGPCTIMIDSILVNNRGLTAFLERHGDSRLTVIYRELHGSPDMILNPKTCLTYTNLQALSQKNLPGQKPKPNALQIRLRAMALSFETVFVLISMPVSCTSNALTQLSMMGDFAALCGSLVSGSTGRIVPLWIPSNAGGGAGRQIDTPLFVWTWSLICLHAFDSKVPSSDSTQPGTAIPVIQDETVWELFLCKAGLNAMAAQVVLGMLRKPANALERLQQNLSAGEERSWGLGKFVSMGREQRTKMFGPVVGVNNVERLNTTFAASWEKRESDICNMKR
jgi:hypothetical protein